jgi:hypothetical protein
MQYALTLYPHWAHAVAHLGKRIENRTWRPRGIEPGDWIMIHASSRRPNAPSIDVIRDIVSKRIDPQKIVSGAIVAVARYGGVLAYEDVTSRQIRWWTGPLAWKLSSVIVLPEPVSCKGQMQLWKPSRSVLRKVGEQIDWEG